MEESSSFTSCPKEYSSRPHMLTAEAAGEMVRDRDLEFWGFWNRELVIFHGKMDL